MEKNGKNGTFFYKEQKKMERTERSLEKNGCPTLGLGYKKSIIKKVQCKKMPYNKIILKKVVIKKSI